ncbi:isoleucyl-tRNA synthetase [Spiroplasma sabaudiense Ar-1343]|uniref:Isoleucine--tRNA ligase n=1 Tax=Spiroplasma sabaudiense Ar-1343 TaxID=1276257 RepID=W6AJU2_9MOLU|nr:isoleucine--tRNA ligase [Spiroplasma sabaudiense]AHI53999.1 isoleucyl-tRNA synthetase [Spiroplasma sabaudiense Ar-1343]
MANYKDTLLIQTTEFEMRAGLKDKEPGIQKKWKEQNIYNQKLKLNDKKPLFVLHDGPPYANGSIHVGHALNKTLKDFIVRWKNSSGYKSPYIMGWDTHGLPIETAIAKTGVDRKKVAPEVFRDLCRDYAIEQVENQKKGFARLGIFTDDSVVYKTLDHDFEMSQLKLFAKLVDKGLVYKDLKPIFWSPSSETALAEAEIEYKDVKSPSMYIAAKITDTKAWNLENDFAVVWTTTPWTIPANQLIAAGPEIEYVLIKPEQDNRRFIIAKNLLDSVSEVVGWENCKVIKTFLGTDLQETKYAHPLYETKISKIVLGEHVTSDSGTGLVHTAGGFGEDDFQLVKSQKMQAFAPINNSGHFDVTIEDKDLEGVFYADANKIVGTRLTENNNLLKMKWITHSYPHDWRTKQPVIWRATAQWFVGLEKVIPQIVEQIKNVKTKPEWSQNRLKSLIEDRKEWTISRQRLWGVPIIGFYNAKQELVINSEIVNFVINILEKEGVNVWFSKPADYFLPKAYQKQNFTKETDILDVWFDSGCSNLALENRFKELKRPFDVYLEGNDQYRGWFNSSIINSVIWDGQAPYKQLITHGMTNDESGKKMSKSIGNTVDPLEIANDLGADILRLWVASTDYTDDQRIGSEILKQVGESYRKIRNTIRFILANLGDFDYQKNYQKNLEEVDLFSLHNLSEFKQKISQAYESYQFNTVYQLLNNYVNNELSAFYLDFIKDILYVEATDNLRRRQVQTVLWEQLWVLIDTIRPILAHTSEEIYQSLPAANKLASVHLLDLRSQNFIAPAKLVEKWNKLLIFRNEVNKALEIARDNKIIKKSFEAEIKIELTKEFTEIKTITDLSQILIVSEVSFESVGEPTYQGTIGKVTVSLNSGSKCERCWGIFKTLKTADLCPRCHSVIQNL